MYCELLSTVFLWDHGLNWEKRSCAMRCHLICNSGLCFPFSRCKKCLQYHRIYFRWIKSNYYGEPIKCQEFLIQTKNMHFNSVYVVGIKDVENRAITETAKRKVSLCFIFLLLCWVNGNSESGQRTKNEDESDWVREKSEI